MIDFNETHSKILLELPWLAKVHDQTGYLLKFSASEADQSCCILITDTERVWAEVLESRHMARRARQCNTPEAAYAHTLANSEHESEWRKRQLVQLTNLHSPYNMSDIVFSVSPSANADLEVTLTTDKFTWRWDAMCLLHRWASQVLSAHLIMPLFSLTALSASVDEPIRDMTAYSLTRAADSQAKTAKRSLGRQMVGCMTKPLVLTTLQRITQVIGGTSNPVSVAISEEDYPSLTPVPPLPSISSPSSSAGKRRRSPSPPNRPHNGVPASALRPTASQGGERASDTEDEEEPKPAAARSQRHRPSATSPSRPVDSSPPPSPSSRPNPSSKPAPKVKVEVEDEADAEARRRAAITRIVQDTKSTAVNPGTSVKAAGKRRRF